MECMVSFVCFASIKRYLKIDLITLKENDLIRTLAAKVVFASRKLASLIHKSNLSFQIYELMLYKQKLQV